MLSEIADAADAVLAPAISAGTGVLVRKIIPRVSVRAVILAYRSPGALAQIGAPQVPERARSFILGEALLLGIHQFWGAVAAATWFWRHAKTIFLPTGIAESGADFKEVRESETDSLARQNRSTQNTAMLRPRDETQLVCLHQMRMRRNDADTDSVGAAFSGGDRAAINVAAIAVKLGFVESRHTRILDPTVLSFAVIRFHPPMFRIDCAEINPRAQLQRVAGRNGF